MSFIWPRRRQDRPVSEDDEFIISWTIGPVQPGAVIRERVLSVACSLGTGGKGGR